MKYSEDIYNKLGYLIITNNIDRKGGYKIVRDKDGYLFEQSFKTTQDAQTWIDYVIDMFNTYKVKF